MKYFCLLLLALLLSVCSISCSTFYSKCERPPSILVCAETPKGDIPCYQDGKPSSIDRSTWKKKREGRVSIDLADFTNIQKNLKLLEAYSCGE